MTILFPSIRPIGIGVRLTAVVINTGPTPLCLFTVYAPAEHAETTVHKTKEEGDELEEAGKDEAPEWATKGKE